MSEIREFTCRLQKDEDEILNRLKNNLQIKTDNKCIRFLITEFESLNKRYLAELKEKNKIYQEYETLKRKQTNFVQSLNEFIQHD